MKAIIIENNQVLFINCADQDSHFLINAEDPKLIALNKTNEGVSIIPGEEKNQLISLNQTEAMEQLDVIFPIIHGTLGEDGSIQGMLRMANIPFVGSNVLGSAISMDKDIAKRLLRDAGLGVAKGFAFNIATRKQINYEHVVKELGLPVFIKPANQGSSVGYMFAFLLRFFVRFYSDQSWNCGCFSCEVVSFIERVKVKFS